MTNGVQIGVTGGSGFIGSHLARLLLGSGYGVAVLDNASPKVEGVEWRKADLLNLKELSEAVRGLRFVFHLAAIADASYAAKNPVETMAVNAQGTCNLLQACLENNVERIIYASTIWVYNASLEGNVDENTSLSTDTKHIYTTSKLVGEFLCKDYHNHFGLKYTVLRFGIPYGPGGRFNVIPIFIKRALMKEALHIRGTGEQRRPFVYVEDLAGGCIKALQENAVNSTYNLSSSTTFSLLEIVNIIKQYLGDVEIVWEPERKGELGGEQVIITEKAERELGWKATTSLDEGIRRTIDWYRQELKVIS